MRVVSIFPIKGDKKTCFPSANRKPHFARDQIGSFVLRDPVESLGVKEPIETQQESLFEKSQ